MCVFGGSVPDVGQRTNEFIVSADLIGGDSCFCFGRITAYLL